MILIAIVACEIGFWVAIVAGLALRYLARRPRLGAIALLLAPVIDIALLTLVAIDLIGGATASWHHALAALYIGISVAYGHRMVAWADHRFARRLGTAEPKPKLFGAAYTVACWRDAGLTAVAMGIAAGILWVLILVVGAPARTSELQAFFPVLGVIAGIDLVWAISYTVWPRRAPAYSEG